jgi:hypothetical protein
MERRINSVLRPTVGARIGCQWQVSINTKKGTEIQRRQGGIADFSSGNDAVLTNVDRTAGGVVSRNGGTTDTLDAFAGTSLRWGRGASVCRARIERMAAEGAGQVFVGVAASDPAKTTLYTTTPTSSA